MASKCKRCGSTYSKHCGKCGAWYCDCADLIAYHLNGDCLL